MIYNIASLYITIFLITVCGYKVKVFALFKNLKFFERMYEVKNLTISKP